MRDHLWRAKGYLTHQRLFALAPHEALLTTSCDSQTCLY